MFLAGVSGMPGNGFPYVYIEGAGVVEMGARAARRKRCGHRVRLPRDYIVEEKYLRRIRHLRNLTLAWRTRTVHALTGMVNVGPFGDEIWVEKGLSEPEKRFVIVHELVHARRQMSGEELRDDALEEQVVELEAIAHANRKVLGAQPNGLGMVLLHDFLTARGTTSPRTAQGLAKIHSRISLLLGGIKTTGC